MSTLKTVAGRVKRAAQTRGVKPYQRVVWRGKYVDRRTRSALVHAERAWRRKAKTSKRIVVTQGGWSFAQASAGTHSKAGCVDLQTWHLTPHEREVLINCLRIYGIAAWYRSGPGWYGNEHIHCVMLRHSPEHTDPLAVQQMWAFASGLDGLASGRPDPHWRPRKPRRWSHRRKRIVHTDRWMG